MHFHSGRSALGAGRRWLGCGLLWLGACLALQAQSSSEWTSADVGEVGAAGSSSESGGVFSLHGSGTDVGGTLDEFHFRSVAWTGDGMFIARVTSLSSVDNWAKLGLMVRPDLSAGAPTFFACVNPSRIAALVSRTSAGATATLGSAIEDRYRAMPMWLKVVRDGDEFMMQFSFDGVTWQSRFSQVNIPMPAAIRLGLAITSKADGRLGDGTADSVRFGPILPTNLVAIERGATQVELRWLDNALRETGFAVERSTDNVNFAQVATAPANTAIAGTDTRFTDTTAAPSTTYWYRIRSIGPNGLSQPSAAVSVTTPPSPPAGWATVDVGDTRVGGSLTGSGGVYSLAGAGRGVGGITTTMSVEGQRGYIDVDVYGGQDEFYLASQAWSGDGEFVARISNVHGPARAQAGIILRSGPTVNSASVFALLRPDGSASVTTRSTLTLAFGRTYYASDQQAIAATAPHSALWVKLVRVGQGVMLYSSVDGTAWSEEAFVKAALTSDLRVGFGIASGDSSALATATIDNVSFGPVVTNFAPQAPTNLAVTRVGVDEVQLTWKNQTSVATIDAVEVEHSTDGVTFTRVSTYPQESLLDDRLSPATNYYFRVRAGRGTVFSPYSDVVQAKTFPIPAPPTELIATAISAGEVDLQWRDNSEGERGFVIERSLDNVTFSWIGSFITTQFADRNAVADTTLYYRVKATSDAGDSAYAVASVRTPALSPTGRPTISTQPTSQAAVAGARVVLQTSSPSSTALYQWFVDGYAANSYPTSVSGFAITALSESNTGVYTCRITDAGASVDTAPAIVGVIKSTKTNFNGTEVGPDIVHQNGNVYDQVLATGFYPTINADPGQVTRISFLDLNDDIVQVEFSGAGTLTLRLDAFTAAAPPSLYNQADVKYVKGHAGIVIAGADATTNVSIFTVGRKTAVNQALFRADATYDGVADLAYLAIISTDGRFGGVRAANASFWATRGITGLYAPGVTFTGPVYVGDIGARDNALPMLMTGPAADLRITGGDLLQANAQAVQIGAVSRVQFTAGEDSHGRPFPAKTNQARLQRDGQDVTAQVVAYQ